MRRLIVTLFILLTLVDFTADGAVRRRKTAKAAVPKPAAAVVRPPREPFVTRVDAPTVKSGLQGRNIALWHSHGRYYDKNENRWTWQRGRLLGTVEDLYTMSYTIPYLIPMLENAGAYVMVPRERDLSTWQTILDRDGGLAQKGGYREEKGANGWSTPKGVAGYGFKKQTLTSDSDNPFRMGSVRSVQVTRDKSKVSKALWTADFKEAGEYAVYVSYASLPNSSRHAIYVVNSLAGSEEFEVNQRVGGGTWVYLGTFPFAAGKSATPTVELLNLTPDPAEGKAVVTADAVKIGGGMGAVERGGDTSYYPAFTEGARYWLQQAGMPQSVFTTTGGANDYEDDYKSRGLWVNYLSGGSSENPAQKGLGIPIDLSFALHTDAGVTPSDSQTIGTLPIVYTKGGDLGNGKPRYTSARLASLITSQISNDVARLYEPTWNTRALRDKAYHEAKEPNVPAVLIELLSHQNYADMRYGLDPTFRFTAARAMYKGMLRYMCEQTGSPYIVQPLPVAEFAISGANDQYRLSWKGVDDPLERTAHPEYYIVYERVGDGAFTELAVTDDAFLDVDVEPGVIYSYKIVAANDGGVSFPSEILALCNVPDADRMALIVNGFTRVSGPAEVYADGRIGFDFESDHGVPYIRDIMFTGAQTEFSPEVEWKSNDAPGHGASQSEYETEIFAGNTFDFVYVHGVSMAKARCSFISCGVDAFAGKGAPAGVDVVDLILGKQREIIVGTAKETKFKPFTAEVKTRMEEFASRGGSLLVSGSYVGSDLFGNSYSSPRTAASDATFARETLGMEWRESVTATTGAVQEIRSGFAGLDGSLKLTFNQQLSADCYAVEEPEALGAYGNDAAAFLKYAENSLPAGVAYQGTHHKAITLGFPFETITDGRVRDKLMAQMLTFLCHGRRNTMAMVGEGLRPQVMAGDIVPVDPFSYVPEPAATLLEEPKPRRRHEDGLRSGSRL